MRSFLKTMMYIAVVTGICMAGYTTSAAQSDNLVRNRLKRIALGQAGEVRTELPDLLSEFPNDPGVRLLHAVLVDDAALALPMFEKIVDDYPQSEWADDAQWRVVQIYALRSDTAKAWQTLQEYRKQYPDSEFLLFAAELVKNAVGGMPPSRKASVYESNATDKPIAAQGTPQAAKKTEPAATTASKSTEKPSSEKSAGKPAADTTPPGKSAEKSTPDKSAVQEAAKEKSAADRYALQVGLYSTRQSAESEVEKFRTARMRTEIIEKMVENEKKYAVIIGSYTTHEGAEKAKETVEKYCGCTPFIIER